VEAGGLLRRDLLRAHRGEADLVRQEQLREQQSAEDDDHDAHARAGGKEHADEDDVESA
jgi:hypothetical protein